MEDGKTRKRMLYLLEEMRACEELTEAVEKLARKFSLSKRKVNRLFRKFHRLNISPVILPKTAKMKLPGLETLLTEPN